MGSNYIAEDATITPSIGCINDSTTGYTADFSVNGEVDGWDYYDGIHTYGAWAGFLFGTLYGPFALIGRHTIFLPVDATTHYFVRIVMKYNPWPEDGRDHFALPTQGKLRWRTLQATNWDTNKELYFDIEADNNWHTYIINVGVAQYWQGDVNDLRVWPAVADGRDGDEFFIRTIDIFSIESHECVNTACEKFTEYSYPCPWTGKRASIESAAHTSATRFYVANLSEFVININGYGNEIVKVKEVLNGSGKEVANKLSRAISRTNVGGYSEVQVEYTVYNKFKIHSGSLHETSSIEVIDNDLARYLKFFDSVGNDTSTRTSGETPVDGYSPLSSFKIKTHQAYGLLDNSTRTSLTFNPFQYSVEGGRQDWLASSQGRMSSLIAAAAGDSSTQPVRKYHIIANDGRTIIDYNHPFNATGRIKKLWAMCSLDDPDYDKSKLEGSRKTDELSGAWIQIFRPNRDGDLEVIYEWQLNDRDTNRSYGDPLYSLTQDGVDFDVDVFVNKGDLIGIYNAHMYVGKSLSGVEYDAQFYQVGFKAEIGQAFSPGRLNGDGSAGLLFYAHGTDTQKRLYLDIDLGSRYNIDKVDIKANAINSILEYNIARCLDINWQCDLFGLQHWTHHTKITTPGHFWYQRPNTYYGLNNLSDGVYTVKDGLACDSFTLTYDNSGADWNYAAGPGVVPTNPHYFWVNGDEEWLAVWLHAAWFQQEQSAHEFDWDPVAIYLHFPYEKKKTIYKSKIYFKEKLNFRSFGISTYGGYQYTLGDADDEHYNLVPEYTRIILDGLVHEEGTPNYEQSKDYIFHNPCNGDMILSATSSILYEWDPILSDVIRDYSGTGGTMGESGYFTTQTFKVVDSDAWYASGRTDWQIIEHQWEPITDKGFRIYCDYHKSTKITEMELYGVAQDVGSNLAGSIVMTFSDYRDQWWPTEAEQLSSKTVEVFIGDSPRYLTLEIIPITETIYDDVIISVKTEDLWAGPKGCEYAYHSVASKINSDNEGQPIEVKNVYQAPYDLYVDIDPGKLVEDGLVFYSTMHNKDSINNPAMGPDARFYKLFDYPLVNQDYNSAINCDIYGLENLVDGVDAYYSMNNGLTWYYYGKVFNNLSVDFSNSVGIARSVVQLPIISRNRYWKFHFPYGNALNVREMEVYYQGERLTPLFYQDQGLPEYRGPIADPAPHLDNESIVGSYYAVDADYSIGIDLGHQGSIDTLVLYHDLLACNVNVTDEYIHMYLTGDDLLDHSYYEQPMEVVGTVYNDTTTSGIEHLGKAPIYIDGPGSLLTCPHTTGFDRGLNYTSLDFFFRFKELPAAGQEVIFFSNYSQSKPHFKVDYINGNLELWRYDRRLSSTAKSFNLNQWYHLSYAWGAGNTSPSQYGWFLDGVSQSQSSSGSFSWGAAVNPIVVGSGLKGWISHLRWSNGPARCGSKATRVYNSPSFPVPTVTYEHKFRFNIYSSYDNITFGLYTKADPFHDNREAYWQEGNVYNGVYYNYFALDLENRHDLGIVRDYGAADAYSIDLNTNISYSADNVSGIYDVDFTGSYDDAKWVRINLLSSDNVSKTLRKLGIYPDITSNIAPEGSNYNCDWTNLGPSITAYSTGLNVALDATVDGSSTTGAYVLSNLTNGVINNNISDAWLSDNALTQWVSVDLGEEYVIYRVKLYHGWSDENTDFYAEDYLVESSLNGEDYTTRWSITNNSSFIRTHDVPDPFTARYIRVSITDYRANATLYVKKADGITQYKWRGACLREIEVYQYYGYDYISSDAYPVIAINLKDQFFLTSHTLIGVDVEATTHDWNNGDSYFTWSDSVLDDPRKISFSDWGSAPGYDQWVVIKGPYAANFDYYLKHVIIGSSTKENPINYPWWWSSVVSTISRDYSHAVEISKSSLKISYPASTTLDTVQFIEGSNWGVDSDLAYRDGVSFRWYVSDIDKLDTTDGYFFFGGYDGTNAPQRVEYRWNLTTSGITALSSGWNKPYFRFKSADEVIYNEDADIFSDVRPVMREYTQWQTFGFKFKGKGEAFVMNIDGAVIQRNHFQDSSKFSFGLYLAGQEHLECPLSEFDLRAGTIEFWLRPDYSFVGQDAFGRYRGRSLFHFANVANDVFGMIINSSGINIYYGNISSGLSSLLIENLFTGVIDGLYHIAVVFSANGRNLDVDSSSIKFYINNSVVATNYDTWEYSDEKLFKFTLGGKAPLAFMEGGTRLETTSVDGVISNLRVYNYCRTDFEDSMSNSFRDDLTDLLLPAKMIEISQDNVTYYKVGAAELPFFYEKVPAGDTVQIYVRTTIPAGLTGKEDRTAGIVTSWDIGV